MGNGDSKIVSKLATESFYTCQLKLNGFSSNYSNITVDVACQFNSLPLKVKLAFNFKRMDEVELSFERKQNLRQIVVNRRQMQSRILTKSIFYIFAVAMIAIKILGPLLCVFYPLK